MPTITATPQPAATPPRVRVSITGYTGAVDVIRVHPDGTRDPLRAAEAAVLSGGAWTGEDYEAPYGVSVRYELRDGTATTTRLDPNLTAWLIHPTLPYLSQPLSGRHSTTDVFVRSLGARGRAVSREVMYVPGRSTPIVWAVGSRQAPASELVLRTHTATQEAVMVSLLADASTLLLNASPAAGLGVTWQYISVGDAVDAQFGVDVSERVWTLPYLVVSRPASSGLTVAGGWSWADLAGEFASWSQVPGSFPTWADLAANRRSTAPAPGGGGGTGVYDSGVYDSSTYG